MALRIAICTGDGGSAGSNSPFGSSGGWAMKRGLDPRFGCRMDQQWMAKINRPGWSGGQQFLAVGSRREGVRGQFCKRKSAFSSRQQLPCDGAARPCPDPGGASSSPTSEKRNRMRRARPLLFTLTRHCMKSGCRSRSWHRRAIPYRPDRLARESAPGTYPDHWAATTGPHDQRIIRRM